MKNILKIAGIMFVISLIPNLLGKFVLGPEFMLGKWNLIISSILPVVLMVFLGRKFLRKEGSILSYGEALKDVFLAAIIAGAIGTLVGVFMYQNDQGMKDAYRDYNISAATWGLETGMGFDGKSEAEIQIATDKLKAEMLADTETLEQGYPFKMSGLPMTLISIIIMYLIYALIAAIFIKEKGATA